MLPREKESLDTDHTYQNPDGHFVIYVMKLQSQLMINVPLWISKFRYYFRLWQILAIRCIDNKDVRFLNFDISLRHHLREKLTLRTLISFYYKSKNVKE